jgi:hypothetical protein
MKNIYLDVCCLCRPFDDQSQDKIYLEAESILTILSRCQERSFILVGSDIIDIELSKITNLAKLNKVVALYSLHSSHVAIDEQVKVRALELQHYGLKLFDSLHLALLNLINNHLFC